MNNKRQLTFKSRLHEIIFEADTQAGKLFDIVLLISIVTSVLVVMLDSVISIHNNYGDLLYLFEWLFTILFTIEYVLRIYCVKKPILYITSFFGLVDFLAILPTFFSLVIPGSQYLLVVRILRVLRIFRVFKIVQYLQEAKQLLQALRASKRKISIFLFTVVTIVIIVGSLMYIIEGEENGFSSIPVSIYWAVVTLTTVGYGDITPGTHLGQFLAAIIMILGYAIIAVPTGIVTIEMAKAAKVTTQACPSCGADGHDYDAVFCKYCGTKI